jgi:hypothetical protein
MENTIMYKSLAIMTAVCGGIWLQMASPASAQNLDAYAPNPYVSPPVSPYLNLGVTANGLSNYQTLVRPLIDDREALMRQSIALQKLQQQQPRDPRGGQINEPNRPDLNRQDPKSRPGSVRFYYSHYYPGLQ